MNRIITGAFMIVLLSCLTAISTADIPNLVGNWTGSYTEYQQPSGFIKGEVGEFSLNITEQQDRIFTGFIISPGINRTENKRAFAGVISSDGTELSIAETDNGYSNGKITGTNEIELTYLHDKDPVNAALDHLSRNA